MKYKTIQSKHMLMVKTCLNYYAFGDENVADFHQCFVQVKLQPSH